MLENSTAGMNLPTEHCQICGVRNYQLEIEWNGWHYYRCKNCNLVFLHPLPKEQELRETYSNSKNAHTDAYFTKIKTKIRRAKVRSRILVRRFKKSAIGKRFLDIGCSGGFVTEAARNHGFAATGLDPDSTAIAWAKKKYQKNTFFLGTVEAFAATSPAPFDLIYCSEVIEHVADINTFFRSIRKVSAPGGLIYITTPDISHWRRPKKLENWDVFTPPHHCIFFSRNNLSRLLLQHGFEIIEFRPNIKPGIKLFARQIGEKL